MAHIENRCSTQVKVKNRDDLTKLFPHDKSDDAQRYRAKLLEEGLKTCCAKRARPTASWGWPIRIGATNNCSTSFSSTPS